MTSSIFFFCGALVGFFSFSYSRFALKKLTSKKRRHLLHFTKRFEFFFFVLVFFLVSSLFCREKAREREKE